MSLWGPALDAEIEYRQAQAKKSWGGKKTSSSARTDRISRHEKAQEKRPVRPSRTEQIPKGIAGMRPVSTPARGLFA
jgi:hypothetical protein